MINQTKEYQLKIFLIQKLLDKIIENRSEKLQLLENAVAQETAIQEQLLNALQTGMMPAELSTLDYNFDTTKLNIDFEKPLLDNLISTGADLSMFNSDDLLKQANYGMMPTEFITHEHSLNATDFGLAFGIGILGALLPSISFGENRSDNIAGILHRHQNNLLKNGVESLFGPSESQIIDNTSGAFHRFDNNNHDILSLLFSSFSSQQAITLAAINLISHLAVDAFGATGIPLPGVTYLIKAAEMLIGEDFMAPKWQSRLLSYRHSDLVSTGFTSLGLFVANWVREMPADSFRREKMAMIAHLSTAVTIISLAPLRPDLAARRSLINYASLAMFTKNCIGLYQKTRNMEKSNIKYALETHKLLDDLLKKSKLF